MNHRMAHDQDCNSVYRPGLACNCAVGVYQRLKAWKPDSPAETTAALIDDASEYMRRLIELFNEAYNPDCR